MGSDPQVTVALIGGIGGITISLITTVGSLIINFKAKNSANAAETSANQAVENTTAVGNGFAPDVIKRLENMRATLSNLETNDSSLQRSVSDLSGRVTRLEGYNQGSLW